MKHYLKRWPVATLGMLLLSGCGNLFEGEIQLRNADPTPLNNIETIYISENCEDEWGNPDAAGLSIPPGGASKKFEFDVGTYDIRACFSVTGTCGERRNRDVRINDTNKINVTDDGKEESDGWCS